MVDMDTAMVMDMDMAMERNKGVWKEIREEDKECMSE